MMFSGPVFWIVLVVAGVLLVGLIILLFRPNEKKETEEHEKRLDSLEEQLNSQRDEQSAQLLESAKATRASKPEAPVVTRLRIARNGKDLGEMDLHVIKSMLGDGQLAPEDFYLDTVSNEWMPLDCHPALIR